MPLSTSNTYGIDTIDGINNINKKCIVCNNNATMIVFIFLPNTSDTCKSISHIYEKINKEYLSCSNCIETIQKNIIPKYNLKHGIVSHYRYYGYNTESILTNTNDYNMIPSIFLSDYGKVHVALSCIFETQSIIIIKNNNGKYKYLVPIFFTKRIRRRNTAIKLNYNLEFLYNQNNNLIGLYQIDKDCYSNLSADEANYIRYHNNALFDMALKYNMYAKTLVYMCNIENSIFFGIPMDIIYFIIRLILTSL